MNPAMKLRLLFIVVLSLNSAGMIPARTAETAATNAATAAAGPVALPVNPFPDAIPTGDIVVKAEAALAQYPAPPANAGTDPVEIDIEQKMAAIGPELRAFADETSRVLATSPTLDRIRTLQNLGKYFDGYPGSWQKTISDRLTALAGKLKQLYQDQKTWSDTGKALATAVPAPPAAVSQPVDDVTKRLAAVRRQTLACQTGLLTLQAAVTAQHTLTSGAMERLNGARERAVTELFERNAAPLWSREKTPAPNVANAAGWSQQVGYLKSYIASQPARFAIHGALLMLLTFFFYWLRGYARKWTAEEPGIKLASGIFETPLATAGLLSLLASPVLYYPIAPRLLSAILGALALVPSVILLRRLIEPRLFPILYALVAFFVIEEFRAVGAMSPGHARVFFLAETLAGILFLLWLLLSLHGRATSSSRRFSFAVRFGAMTALVALAAAWIANVCGYVLLGNLLGEAVQRSATLALVLYAGLRVIEAILFITTRLRPLSTFGMVRLHGPVLLSRIQHGLAVVAGLFWTLYTLELFSLAAPIMEALRTFFTKYDESKHELVLRFPGKILAAVLIGWGVFQLSKFVRLGLQTDVYPRLRLSAGIPYAISTSLHYAMLVVAFIGATYVLGIDMTKFTIVVSALGVGVGFGLQNIINNFVSGLILLFERPVKIGDSIQSGDAIGVVERIGIRASVLRTTTGAEMIVPNGNLISSTVTNWTLSTEDRIIIIPFNVVRGPEVARVMDLFVAAAAANPKVLKNPPPQVLVTALGANLGFELRAWTREVGDWNVLRSELALAINAVLIRENIALA